jgi:hypothetical protein
MRFCISCLALALLGIPSSIGSVQAQVSPYPWCAEYYTESGSHGSCGYSTQQQCLSYVSGLSGSCYRNPGLPELRPAPPRQRRVR